MLQLKETVSGCEFTPDADWQGHYANHKAPNQAPATTGFRPISSTTVKFEIEIQKPRAAYLDQTSGGLSVPGSDAHTGEPIGNLRPLLVAHGMTPFARLGDKPPGIWACGLTVSFEGLTDADIDTVDWYPRSQHRLKGEATLATTAQLKVGGSTATKLPPGLVAAVVAESGLELSVDGQAEAAVGLEGGVRLDLKESVYKSKITAGPFGHAGNRWDIFTDSSEPPDKTHNFYQIVLLARHVRCLKIKTQAWVRGQGFWKLPPMEWRTRSSTIELPLGEAQ